MSKNHKKMIGLLLLILGFILFFTPNNHLIDTPNNDLIDAIAGTFTGLGISLLISGKSVRSKNIAKSVNNF